MKTFIRTFILLLAFGVSLKAMTQGTTLTVFSEKGENFTVLVNGDQKNSKPGDHVKIEGLYGPSFKLRIVFKDVSIREIEKTVFNSSSGELFYVVRPGKKGNYILEKTSSDYIHSQEAVKESTPASSTQKENKQTDAKSESQAKKSGGCSSPMSEPDFQVASVAVSSAPFDGIKLSQAKKVAESHCLTSHQIVELMYILSYDPQRLNLAKAAYKHCFDPENYDEVKDVLNSAKSKNELDSYIQTVK